MPNVQVTFSASIKELIDATKSVEEAIKRVGETAKQANEMMSKFGEIVGISLTVEGIKSLVENMAKLGETVERNAKFLGVSTTDMQQLGYMAKITGGDAETLAKSIARFENNLSKAAVTGKGPAAEALRALGVDAKALASLPLDQQMNKVSDAFNKFADGAQKDVLAVRLFNRSAQEMSGMLDGGSAHLDEMRQKAVDLGQVMTDQAVKSLADTEKGLTTLGGALRTVAGEFFATHPGVQGFIDDLITTASNTSALIASGTMWDYVVKAVADDYDLLAARLGKVKTALADAFVPAEQFNKDMAAADANIEALARKAVSDSEEMVKRAQAVRKELLASGDEGEKDKRPKAPAPIKDDSNAAAIAQYNNLIALADKRFDEEAKHEEALAKMGVITESQKTQALLAANKQREDYELSQLAFEKSLGNLSVEQTQAIENKKLEIIQKTEAKKKEIEDQSNEYYMAKAKAAGDVVAGAFNSQLRQILSGQETWAAAMKNVFADLILKMIEKIDLLAAEWLAKEALEIAEAAILAILTGGSSMASGGSGFMGSGMFTPPGKAGGGAVQAGAPYLIGERGPEIMVPSTAGNIVPNNAIGRATSAAMNQDRGDTHIHFNVSAIDGPSVQSFFQSNVSQISRVISAHMNLNPSYSAG